MRLLLRPRGPPGPDARRDKVLARHRGGDMKRWIAPMLVIVATLANAPAAQAAHSRDTFLLIAEEENFGTAPNGDVIEVTVDEGSWFDGSPKAVSATGDFTHFAPDGTVRASGTWTATGLISYDFYGCRYIPALGVDTRNDDFCGGAVKMAIVATVGTAHFPAMLTVFCIVGTQAPSSHNGSK